MLVWLELVAVHAGVLVALGLRLKGWLAIGTPMPASGEGVPLLSRQLIHVSLWEAVCRPRDVVRAARVTRLCRVHFFPSSLTIIHFDSSFPLDVGKLSSLCRHYLVVMLLVAVCAVILSAQGHHLELGIQRQEPGARLLE